jgi:surface antigen
MTEFSLEKISSPMGLAGVCPSFAAEGEFNGWNWIKSRLTEFAQLPNAYLLLDSVFDIKDQYAACTTLNEWKDGIFSQLPVISVLADVEMQGALGGYSSDTRNIYLAKSIAGVDSITGKVLAEELGHHLDNHFNGFSDTNGDEGDLFSRVLLGFEINEKDLSNVLSEDDSGFVFVDNRPILVERSQVAIESMGGLLYQTQRGTDSKIYTRVSADGKTWSPWNESGGVTNSAPGLAVLNGTLYQVHRGVDNKIYTRSSNSGSSWTSWHEAGGVTESAIAVAALNDRLYQSHRGLDNKIYTRSTLNGTNWTGWNEAGGETNHAPALATLNGRLYQSIKGIDNRIYTRSSTNGISWTSWHQAGGVTYSQPALESANGQLYQSHRGTDNQIYTRSSTDGMTWTNWHQVGGVSNFAPSIASLNGRLYQTHRGLDNSIYTRSSADGIHWDQWNAGATTNSPFYRVDRLNSDGNEGNRHTFRIFRIGSTASTGQVRFSTSSDSATSDVDFSSYSAFRNFAPGQTEDVVYVDSRTDTVNEGTERFNVSISKVNNADTIAIGSTFGSIFNVSPTSPPPSVGVSQPDFTLTVYRSGNALWRAGFAPASVSPPGGSKLNGALGNCTWYANGRIKQLGMNPSKVDRLTGDATKWLAQARNAGFTISREPKVGSVAYWAATSSNPWGHVAVVERVNSNGTILISESAYDPTPSKSYLFKTRTISSSSPTSFLTA